MAAIRSRIGEWTADPASNLLQKGERTVRLEPRAMDVLMHLAAHTGEVTSVGELMSAVWKNVVVTDGSVYLAISQLRQALGDVPSGLSYIETVPKRGYRLIVPVEPLVTDSVAVPQALTSRRSWTTPALAMAVVAAVLTLFWILRPTAAAPDHSLAVLPFADLSPAGDQAYFADGITEEVLNRLATLRDLRVIGRTSSFQLRGQSAEASAVGEKLGVEHVLVGSVRKAGDKVRVTAQLTAARTGQQLWSQTYERRLEDIFAVQDEIAKSVATAMEVKLGVGELARMPGMTRDVAAYDEYLRGMALNIVGRRETFPQAIAHLQRAIAIDPQFSMAWSGLSGTYSSGAFAVPERATEWRRAAAESLEHARQLTPDAPHVLLGLGIVAMRGGDWLGCADFFRRLEEVHAERGMSAESAGPRGALLLAAGRIRDAIPALESARAHDPLAPGYASFLSLAYLAKGDHRAALGEIDRGLKLEGLHESLLSSGFSIALASGDRDEIGRRLAALTDDVPTARVNRRLAQFLDHSAGGSAEIRTLVSAANDMEKVALAAWAAYYEDRALALEILTDVTPRRSHPGIIWHPLFAKARALPEFSEFVERMGMTRYWRVYGFADFCEPVRQRIVCR
jgi:TolB-like protein/DNA-binding winged helix-turn-helix (wHTH) protein/Flp pilus assembly protein TadD